MYRGYFSLNFRTRSSDSKELFAHAEERQAARRIQWPLTSSSSRILVSAFERQSNVQSDGETGSTFAQWSEKTAKYSRDPDERSKKRLPPQNFIRRKSDSKVFPPSTRRSRRVPHRAEGLSFILDNGEQKGSEASRWCLLIPWRSWLRN